MTRLALITFLLSILLPQAGRSQGIPGPGEERSSLAPLELGIGYGVPMRFHPAFILRMGYTFKPTYAFTAAYYVHENGFEGSPFASGNIYQDLRLGLQVSGYIWEDLEFLLAGFHRMNLTHRATTWVRPCEGGYACYGSGPAEWRMDPVAGTGLQWGARFWLLPRLSVLLLDGMEWEWEEAGFEIEPISILFGVHF